VDQAHQWPVRRAGGIEPHGDAAARAGKDLANLHKKQVKQFKGTVERRASGELKNPRIELARPGLTGSVTRDGYLP
jgi:hypothetical protein